MFAERVEALFNEKGWKNNQLAPAVSASIIQKIRNQNYLPEDRTVGKIAEALKNLKHPVQYEELIELWRRQRSTVEESQAKTAASTGNNQDFELKNAASAVGRMSGLSSEVADLVVQKTRDFVGRSYVFDAIDEFLKGRPSGYLHIRGDPGQGKTAILAELVRRRACPAHFNIRAERRTGAAQFFNTLRSQLLGSGASTAKKETSAADLRHMLHGASARLRPHEQLVIVVYALDELDPSARNAGENILCLPLSLPDGVYFVLSSRRGVTIPLQASSIQQLDLSAFNKESIEDIKVYVERATHRPAIQRWLRSIKLRPSAFIESLAEKSQCNFMYLSYVLHDVEMNQYTDKTFLVLPVGLQNYYHMHWERMGMLREPVNRGRLILLFTLSQVRMPVSRALLAEFSQLDEMTVQQTLDEWSQFLHRQSLGGEPRWSIYHNSFLDFLEQADIIQAAGVSLPDIHKTISDQLLKGLHDSGPA